MPDMPPLDGSDYLIGDLFEIGPTMAAGMGEGPLTFGEIQAWIELTGVKRQPWEIRFLRRLSLEYLAQSHKSTKPDCLAPYGMESRREIVAAKIDNIFG